MTAAPSAMDPSWQFRSPSLTCRNTMIIGIATGSAAVWIRGRRLPEARANCQRLIELMPRGTMIVVGVPRRGPIVWRPDSRP